MIARELLEECTEGDILGYWNTFCDITNYDGDKVFHMYEFESIVMPDNIPFKDMYGKLDKNFNFDHEYFWWDGLGYINSGYACDFIDRIVDFDLLADSIDENSREYNIELGDY